MSQPLLSIGMIVKNEERCLEKCLKALEPLRQTIPCELVIADTGSTDKTKEIASKYADILFDFKWVNDFSKARNAVIDKCSGKWFIYIDADEYLLSDVTELVDLVSEKHPGANHGLVTIRDYASTTLQGIYSDFSALRITRLNRNTRFINTIHERLDITDTENAVSLSNTIFAHDGYANSDSDFIKKKMLRNLELLEKEYQKEPNDTTIILQILESSHIDVQLKSKYSKIAMEHIQSLDKTTPAFTLLAPAIARKAIQYAVFDNYPETLSWFEFAENNFKTSFFYLIDIIYLKLQWLFDEKEYEKIIFLSKEYFKNINKYQSSKKQLQTNIISSIKFAHIINQYSVMILVANAHIQLKNQDEAFNVLSKVDLKKVSPQLLQQWLTVSKNLDIDKAQHLIKTSVAIIDEEDELYENFLEYIKPDFSCTPNSSAIHKIYIILNNDLGISAKLCETKTKKEAEKLLGSIKDWNKLMPLALKQALLLKCDLPEEFYLINQAHLSFLEQDLSNSAEELVDVLTEHYCDTGKYNNFSHVSFVFNLLSAILLNNPNTTSDIAKSKYLEKFIIISNEYLNTCYNPDLLQDEEAIVCILPQHLFSWYLIKAYSKKTTAPLEYVKILRIALNRIPEAKPIIEFLISELQKEEELKKQTQVKNASPELIALAEQLKVMLSAFPENSPELLAIKQSPMYKQVAFLIED